MARNAIRQEDVDSPLTASEDKDFQPKTPLGRRLWELRKRIVVSGEPLLDWDDLEREIAERRGGVSETE
ncbi:MAG: hypothetical protein WAM82_00585 [Thermoanaerobaculia bacterium]